MVTSTLVSRANAAELDDVSVGVERNVPDAEKSTVGEVPVGVTKRNVAYPDVLLMSKAAFGVVSSIPINVGP